MFGEKSIYGQSSVKIDNKGRMFLPAFTKREIGDNLVLIRDNDISRYKICSSNRLDEIIKELRQKKLAALTEIEKENYSKAELLLIKSFIKNLKVDNQKRVNTGKIFEGIDRILCIGDFDSIILEPIEEVEEASIKL